jgi:uncharacterized protein (DUF58 family)
MGENFFLLLILLAFVAIFLREDFVLALVYLFVGVFAVGRWWSRRAMDGVRFTRTFPRRALFGEQVPVKLEIINTRWLPVVWLQFTDNLPIELNAPHASRYVVSLGAHERAQLKCTLQASKRGYYPIGPLRLRSGDLIGLAGEVYREGPAEYLTVYPKIILLSNLKLPSRSPIGTLRHTQPIYEDPSRVRGKRDYVAGDSLRSIDWKASAALGRLQVKQFEPSIALETAIFLNLNSQEYHYRGRIEATELAIVVAASIANWIVGRRQSVGLAVNGLDPVAADGRVQFLPPRKGRAQLIRLLDVLARIRSVEAEPLAEVVQRELARLTWGTTLVLITGTADDAVFETIFRARRLGLEVTLILIGTVVDSAAIRQRAKHFNIPLYEFSRERDLDVWR